MKSILLFVMLGAAVAVAGAGEASRSPEAIEVIDRAVRAAAQSQQYAARISKTIVEQDLHVQQGAAQLPVARNLATTTVAFRAPGWLWRNAAYDEGRTITLADGDTQYQYYNGAPEKIDSKPVSSLPGMGLEAYPDLRFNVLTPLTLQVSFLAEWRDDAAVSIEYSGQQLVNGVLCDVLELAVPLAERTWTQARVTNPALPDTPGHAAYVYYIGVMDGWVHRSTITRQIAGVSRFWLETTYDIRPLDPQERFDFERLAAEVQSMVGEQPLPPVVEAFNDSGRSLPELQATLYDGGELDWRDYHGKVLVVETWATWCGYCKKAMPYYEKMRQALAAQGVVFMALNFEEEQEKYEQWVLENREHYGFVFARAQTTRENWREVLQQFKGSLPAFYVVGRDGKVISGYSGYGYSEDQADPRLLAALAEAGVRP